MSVECLLDTNVLVYAVSALEEDAEKKARALQLIGSTEFGLSTQILQEFYVTVTHKIRKPLPADLAVAMLDQYRHFPTAHTDYPLVLTAIDYSLRYKISYWDGAILAAAEALEAKVVYTEDLAHGQSYGPVQVLNPFVDS